MAVTTPARSRADRPGAVGRQPTRTRRPRPSTRAALADAIQRSLANPLASYYLVLGVGAMLLVLGLVMVLSASSVYSWQRYGSSYSIFERQAVWVAAALPLAYLASRIPLRLVRAASWPAVLVSCVLLALTYIPGIGYSVNGNRNWLSFGGPFQIQPSELAKLALVLWCADVYARKYKLLRDWKHLIFPVMPACTVVGVLVVGQGDLGTALVLFAIVLGMLWVVGAPGKLFGTTVLVVASFAFALAMTQQERVQRLTTYLDPLAQYNGSGWQASHGFFALANGGLWGVGIGASNQKWGGLPEAHTDFIFAIIGEEFGLFGTLVVLGLFITLAFAGIRIAVRTRDNFVRFASGGIVIWLLSQTVINIGMVLGFLPVIGIPLPLISYGGSALVPTLVAIGLLLSFSKTEPGAAAALRRRRRTRRRRSA